MFDPINFPKPRMISLGDVQLEVFEAGKENKGNPIVLCHGWPEHAFTWRYQISALVDAGYHVIIPNQRGFGNSSCPEEVTAYDIKALSSDLVSLLDYFGYKKAVFVGHDWGANVVWGLSLMHPKRVSKIINLSLPYQERGEKPWIEWMEEFLGEDNYMVHFNRHVGVADKILEENTERFLKNTFRKDITSFPFEKGMVMINLAKSKKPLGKPLMSDKELEVFIAAFKKSGFRSSINWYRNIDRNWHILADVDPIISHPALMIYADRDMIPKSFNLSKFVPNVDVIDFDCGHWIPEEKPEETNKAIISWLNS